MLLHGVDSLCVARTLRRAAIASGRPILHNIDNCGVVQDRWSYSFLVRPGDTINKLKFGQVGAVNMRCNTVPVLQGEPRLRGGDAYIRKF